MTTLRASLKDATRALHDDVELRYGKLDIQTRDGLTRLLQAHALALSWCIESLPPEAFWARPDLVQLMKAIGEDLACLGVLPPRSAARPANPGSSPHPLGLIYVIAGSRLGASVLLKQVESSTDPLVRTSTAYLSCPAGARLWRETRKALETWQGPVGEQDDIMRATKTAFSWFAEALDQELACK